MGEFQYFQGNGNILNGNGSKKNNSVSIAPQELIDFKWLFSIMGRYKWVLSLFLLLAVTGTYFLVNHYLLPIYKSKATVLISNSQTALPASQNDVSQIISNSFSLGAGQSGVESAIYLFGSRELSNEVAKGMLDLQKQPDGEKYPILWTDYPEDSTTAEPSVVADRIRQGLTVEPVEPGAPLLAITFESYSPYESARVVNFAIHSYQQLSVQKKQKSAEAAHDFLTQKKQELKEELAQSEQQLSQFTGNRNLVALESQTSNLVTSLSNLEAERQALVIQLESTDTAIKNYENQLESIKPGLTEQYSKALGPTISSYQQRLAQLTTQRFVLLSNNPRLKDNPNSEPELKRLNQQIAELRQEIESLSSEMLGQNSNYLGFLGDNNGNITEELTNIQNKLMELGIQKSQLEAQISAMDQRINESRGFLNRVPENQIQLARLQRTVEMNRELYTTISKQEAEIGLWQQSQTSNATVFDHATVNMYPVKPQKVLWYLGSLLVGFLLPFMVIVTKEHFTSVINSTDRLKALPYPLLSVIFDYSLLERGGGWALNSFSKNKNGSSGIGQDIVLYHDTTSPISESYRRMVGNLLYGNPDQVPRSLLVTSSGPGEGKTTLSCNLGWALAEIDKRVLIIDCDFRRPSVHKQFGISLTPGLTELVYDEAEIEETIQSTPMSGLYVLPAGQKPIQPAKLTSSSKFRQLVNKFKKEYDMVVFDSPPYGIVSDIAPIVGMSDQLIVTAKFNDTKELVLKNTLDDLSRGYHCNIGLVLTMYKPAKSSDSYETKRLHQYKYQEYYDYTRVTK